MADNAGRVEQLPFQFGPSAGVAASKGRAFLHAKCRIREFVFMLSRSWRYMLYCVMRVFEFVSSYLYSVAAGAASFTAFECKRCEFSRPQGLGVCG